MGLVRAGSVRYQVRPATGKGQDHSRRPPKGTICKYVGRMQRNARHVSGAGVPLGPKGQGEEAVIRIQMRESYRKGLLESPAEARSTSQVPHREGARE